MPCWLVLLSLAVLSELSLLLIVHEVAWCSVMTTGFLQQMSQLTCSLWTTIDFDCLELHPVGRTTMPGLTFNYQLPFSLKP